MNELASTQSSFLTDHFNSSYYAFPALLYVQRRGATLGAVRGKEVGMIKRVIPGIYFSLPLAILAFHLTMNLSYLNLGIFGRGFFKDFF